MKYGTQNRKSNGKKPLFICRFLNRKNKQSKSVCQQTKHANTLTKPMPNPSQTHTHTGWLKLVATQNKKKTKKQKCAHNKEFMVASKVKKKDANTFKNSAPKYENTVPPTVSIPKKV